MNSKNVGVGIALVLLLSSGFTISARAEPRAPKGVGVFYPARLIEKAKANAAKYPWAVQIQKETIAAAQPWMQRSDDDLWNLMFGNTIKRAWQVWSNGYCPICKASVPMYAWQMDALDHPWKTRCPHCKEYFPKNDFGKYYRSGLDEHNVFDPRRADRGLLFNTEHPDPNDPLHHFAVDDGEGWVEGDHRWRFINAYLIFGQWKQTIVAEIRNLAAAYAVTGDRAYAHKAGVLLDRVADLYPTMDFGKEGVMYEGPPSAGYVSTWHDANEETRSMALAYDQVVEALRDDKELAGFLAEKSRRYHIDNPKTTCADVLGNIEDRILRDAVNSPKKIYSNYPQPDITVSIIKTVLDWADNRGEVRAIFDRVLEQASAVDGVTGEKGLAGYSAYAIQGTARFLAQYSQMDPDFLREMLQRHPRLHAMFRFHIDTWCLQRYYPQIGDTGAFARPVDQYAGVAFVKNPGIAPSMFSFLWQLYNLTGDKAFAQALYRANGDSTKDLPYDLFANDPDAVQRGVADVIAREGKTIRLGSVNKPAWHLAILRSAPADTGVRLDASGNAEANAHTDDRALWLDYDFGGYHAHADGMNLGLFAFGLDLLPDLGYPPVNYGGWDAPRSLWYKMTAAHNTVAVDSRNHRNLVGPITERAGFEGQPAGKTTLWAEGKQFHAIRASGPAIVSETQKQFERTVALIDISDKAFYALDVFRVVGGVDHAKFLHSHFGTITTQGLSLSPIPDYGHDTQMRSFRADADARPGWSVDWKIEDRYKLLPPNSDIHLRCTELTTGAQAAVAEAWVSIDSYSQSADAWIPEIMVRRQAKDGPLASTFISVLEPYKTASQIAHIQRLPLETPKGQAYPDANAAVEVQLLGGGRDLLVAADVENPLGQTPAYATEPILVQKQWKLRTDAQLCLVRQDAAGKTRRVVLCHGSSLQCGDLTVKLKPGTDFIEIAIEQGQSTIVSGEAAALLEIKVKGQAK